MKQYRETHKEKLEELKKEYLLKVEQYHIEDNHRNAMVVEKAISLMYDFYGVNKYQLMPEGRIQKHLDKRNIYCFVVWMNTTLPLKAIAKLIGRDDHSTARFNIQTIKGFIEMGDPSMVEFEDILNYNFSDI